MKLETVQVRISVEHLEKLEQLSLQWCRIHAKNNAAEVAAFKQQELEVQASARARNEDPVIEHRSLAVCRGDTISILLDYGEAHARALLTEEESKWR